MILLTLLLTALSIFFVTIRDIKNKKITSVTILIDIAILIIGLLIAIISYVSNNQQSNTLTNINTTSERTNKYLFSDSTNPILLITAYQSKYIDSFTIVNFHIINDGKHPMNNINIKFEDAFGWYIGRHLTIRDKSIDTVPDDRYKNGNSIFYFDKTIETIPANHLIKNYYVTSLPFKLDGTYNIVVTMAKGSYEYLIKVKNQNPIIVHYDYVQTSNNIHLDKKEILKVARERFPMYNISYP